VWVKRAVNGADDVVHAARSYVTNPRNTVATNRLLGSS
jgi:hypothetical protein